MFDQAEAEGLLYRTAIACLNYYPTKRDVEPGYTIDEDLDYCLEALASVPDENRGRMRARLTDVIIDPTAHRAAFTRDVRALITRPAASSLRG